MDYIYVDAPGCGMYVAVAACLSVLRATRDECGNYNSKSTAASREIDAIGPA